jgi:hypothetical protein
LGWTSQVDAGSPAFILTSLLCSCGALVQSIFLFLISFPECRERRTIKASYEFAKAC